MQTGRARAKGAWAKIPIPISWQETGGAWVCAGTIRYLKKKKNKYPYIPPLPRGVYALLRKC